MTSVAYSPDESEIVRGMLFGDVMIWKTDTKEIYRLGRHTDAVTSVAFSPDGSRIASGSDDRTVRIWDPTLRETTDKKVEIERLSVALSHDGRWIVTGLLSHIQVWRVSETMTKANDVINKKYMESLALSRDGSRVVIGMWRGDIQVWNHLTNTTECQMSGHSDDVSCVAFSYDGSYVVSGSKDKTIRVWDCHTVNQVALHRHWNEVVCVAFSRDGGRVAFGDDNGIVRIWNISTGEIHRGPNMSEGGVFPVAFSHDDSYVISGSWVWNVTTNKCVKLSTRFQLPDGTRVHSLSKGDFHIYDPVDQETPKDIPRYLLSISPDRDWITGEQAEHNCWIPPQYRAFSKAHISESIVCLQSHSSMIVLDLKYTHRTGRIMPEV